MGLVMPFISALGYNVFDPTEVIPEFTADIGIKKGEKVDYAIIKSGKPIILIECKWCGSNLDKEQASQLYRYFSAAPVKFGILTNGLVYKFFTDLEEKNKMDSRPFFEFNIMSMKETDVEEIKKFSKETFDLETNLSAASELKYSNDIKRYFAEQLQIPDEDFVKMIAKKCYSGTLTQAVKEKFTEITKMALNQFISEKINERLKSAMNQDDLGQSSIQPSQPNLPQEPVSTQIETTESKFVTSEEEIEGYYIVKSILRELVDPKRVVMKDTKNYCGIWLDNIRKSICRFYFNKQSKCVGFLKDDKTEEKILIENVNEIYKVSDRLKEIVLSYEKPVSSNNNIIADTQS